MPPRIQQSSKMCKRCKQYRLHARPGMEMGQVIAASFLTCGILFPLWLAMYLFGAGDGSRWRCQVCGKARW